MKRLFGILLGTALLMSSGFCAEPPLAVLHKTDGRAWKVFLIKNGQEKLTIRLHKSKANTTVEADEVDRLEIEHPEYNADIVQLRFNQADYPAVIAALEPVVLPATDYMGFPNNLQESCDQLMQAYSWNGDAEKAAALADLLRITPDPEREVSALVIRALSALVQNDVATAETCRAAIDDPAAELYVRAAIEQAQGEPEKSIQSIVDLIATHPNNLRWMPSAELLCSKLYLELGMTNSAAATARQTEKLYVGMNVEKEAQALRSTISESTEQPEE